MCTTNFTAISAITFPEMSVTNGQTKCMDGHCYIASLAG
uniref:Uncharacterized protein n=1 Tax=Anguilla anguilla TaxID=7936 RepID=A0A0E9U3B7_ANGAN